MACCAECAAKKMMTCGPCAKGAPCAQGIDAPSGRSNAPMQEPAQHIRMIKPRVPGLNDSAPPIQPIVALIPPPGSSPSWIIGTAIAATIGGLVLMLWPSSKSYGRLHNPIDSLAVYRTDVERILVREYDLPHTFALDLIHSRRGQHQIDAAFNSNRSASYAATRLAKAAGLAA